jgi:hypothetical protein
VIESLTDQALEEIEALANEARRMSLNVPGALARLACDNVPRLIIEIRRFHKREERIAQNAAVILQENRRLQSEFEIMTIERDNLRKMLDDAHALAELQLRALMGARDRIHELESNQGGSSSP